MPYQLCRLSGQKGVRSRLGFAHPNLGYRYNLECLLRPS